MSWLLRLKGRSASQPGLHLGELFAPPTGNNLGGAAQSGRRRLRLIKMSKSARDAGNRAFRPGGVCLAKLSDCSQLNPFTVTNRD
jgi:hypothetical protein